LRILHLAPQASDESGVAAYAVRYREAVAAQPGCEIVPLDRPSPAPDTVADVRGYVAAARRAAPAFDVVHAELGGSALREPYAARALARAGGPPLVLTVHDPPRLAWRPFHTALVREHRTLRGLAAVAGDRPARRLERDLARRSAALLTLSERGARRLTEALGPATPVRALPYPCVPVPPAAAPPAPAADGALVVGFHGYWYGGKGIEVLLAALALTGRDAGRPPVRLRLWGAPPAGGGDRAGARYRARILAAVDRLGLRGAVEVGGRLPDDALVACLRTCDAIVFPYEERRTAAGLASISSAVFDVLGAGVPVVVSDVRAIGATVDAGVDGLTVPPGDAAALADALRRLRDDPGLRERLRAGAVARAAAFGLDATGHEAAAVYETVARGRR
jgi:glycogen synthase